MVVRDAYDAITVLNFAGKILAWNAGAERLYGWHEADALTMTVFDMISEEQKAEMVTLIEQLQQGEILPPTEITHNCHDGTMVNVLLTATILFDANDKPYAIATTEKKIAHGSHGA